MPEAPAIITREELGTIKPEPVNVSKFLELDKNPLLTGREKLYARTASRNIGLMQEPWYVKKRGGEEHLQERRPHFFFSDPTIGEAVGHMLRISNSFTDLVYNVHRHIPEHAPSLKGFAGSIETDIRIVTETFAKLTRGNFLKTALVENDANCLDGALATALIGKLYYRSQGEDVQIVPYNMVTKKPTTELGHAHYGLMWKEDGERYIYSVSFGDPIPLTIAQQGSDAIRRFFLGLLEDNPEMNKLSSEKKETRVKKPSTHVLNMVRSVRELDKN